MAVKWKQFNLIDLVTISTKKVGAFDGEKEYIATGDIDGDRIVSNQVVTYANKPSRADLLLSSRDVLFAKMKGTVKVLVGKKEYEEKIFSTGFYVITPKESVSLNFLYFFLISNEFNLQKDSYCTGATMSAITNEGLKKIKVRLPLNKDGEPDVEEQNRIASLLNDAQCIKNKRLEANQKTSILNTSLFMQIFKDDIANVKSYTKLEKEITYLTSGARGWAKYYCNDGGSKYIRIQNVKSSKLLFDDVQYVKVTDSAESKRIKVAAGDLLISITADLGRTAVVDEATAKEGAYINQHIALLRLSEAYNPLFVSYFLESNLGKDQFLKYGQAAAKKGLNFDSIKSLKIPKPPIELQNKFADLVKEIEVQKDIQKKSTERVDELFNAVMAKSFS